MTQQSIGHQVGGPEDRVVSAKMGQKVLRSCAYGQYGMTLPFAYNLQGVSGLSEVWYKNVEYVNSSRTEELAVAFESSAEDSEEWYAAQAQFAACGLASLKDWTVSGVVSAIPTDVLRQFCTETIPAAGGLMLHSHSAPSAVSFGNFDSEAEINEQHPGVPRYTFSSSSAGYDGTFPIDDNQWAGPVPVTIPISYAQRVPLHSLYYRASDDRYVAEGLVTRGVDQATPYGEHGTTTTPTDSVFRHVTSLISVPATEALLCKKAYTADDLRTRVAIYVEVGEVPSFTALLEGSCDIPVVCRFTLFGADHEIDGLYKYRLVGGVDESVISTVAYSPVTGFLSAFQAAVAGGSAALNNPAGFYRNTLQSTYPTVPLPSGTLAYGVLYLPPFTFDLAESTVECFTRNSYTVDVPGYGLRTFSVPNDLLLEGYYGLVEDASGTLCTTGIDIQEATPYLRGHQWISTYGITYQDLSLSYANILSALRRLAGVGGTAFTTTMISTTVPTASHLAALGTLDVEAADTVSLGFLGHSSICVLPTQYLPRFTSASMANRAVVSTYAKPDLLFAQSSERYEVSYISGSSAVTGTTTTTSTNAYDRRYRSAGVSTYSALSTYHRENTGEVYHANRLNMQGAVLAVGAGASTPYIQTNQATSEYLSETVSGAGGYSGHTASYTADVVEAGHIRTQFGAPIAVQPREGCVTVCAPAWYLPVGQTATYTFYVQPLTGSPILVGSRDFEAGSTAYLSASTYTGIPVHAYPVTHGGEFGGRAAVCRYYKDTVRVSADGRVCIPVEGNVVIDGVAALTRVHEPFPPAYTGALPIQTASIIAVLPTHVEGETYSTLVWLAGVPSNTAHIYIYVTVDGVPKVTYSRWSYQVAYKEVAGYGTVAEVSVSVPVSLGAVTEVSLMCTVALTYNAAPVMRTPVYTFTTGVPGASLGASALTYRQESQTLGVGGTNVIEDTVAHNTRVYLYPSMGLLREADHGYYAEKGGLDGEEWTVVFRSSAIPSIPGYAVVVQPTSFQGLYYGYAEVAESALTYPQALAHLNTLYSQAASGDSALLAEYYDDVRTRVFVLTPYDSKIDGSDIRPVIYEAFIHTYMQKVDVLLNDFMSPELFFIASVSTESFTLLPVSATIQQVPDYTIKITT